MLEKMLARSLNQVTGLKVLFPLEVHEFDWLGGSEVQGPASAASTAAGVGTARRAIVLRQGIRRNISKIPKYNLFADRRHRMEKDSNERR